MLLATEKQLKTYIDGLMNNDMAYSGYWRIVGYDVRYLLREIVAVSIHKLYYVIHRVLLQEFYSTVVRWKFKCIN
jgi:hypothetical protein